MKLYAAVWYDTDGFTYGCDTVLGVYSTRALADARCLLHSEETKQSLDNYESREFEVDSDWE